MKTSKTIFPAAAISLLLSLSPAGVKAQHAAQAFSDKEAVAKMAKNFESPARDSMQQPGKVLLYLGDIRDKTIMDLGAATGYFSLKFAAAGARVIAADVSDAFQEYLQERITKDKIRNITTRKIPYDNPQLQDQEADLVFVANTYHHIEDRIVYFAKVKRGLKNGGCLVILDFFKARFTETVQAPAMAMRASVDEVVLELRQAGFQSFDVEVNLLPYQYIIKAR
ncbi:class I SAM-dependent methyltransferase [Taibaiella chishuiensis]|uniref:Methyltransferase family protein n=1 Tax=Taibaiella chishuiensis TaxID=1434707 RepID=A0A2P8D8E9_9BACT|nr:methyltransferase domain-containing protein [Taibaiella chishuiensis]PSK93504.1 methyltransferase family protein [Taibaiella chishuiensis]